MKNKKMTFNEFSTHLKNATLSVNDALAFTNYVQDLVRRDEVNFISGSWLSYNGSYSILIRKSGTCYSLLLCDNSKCFKSILGDLTVLADKKLLVMDGVQKRGELFYDRHADTLMYGQYGSFYREETLLRQELLKELNNSIHEEESLFL